ncbi:MAG: adenylate/guanylate cyclase domain-containing protein [Actinobacteria bacterium]|nr:adenylate/guanylate cyclase domain-containing protein [Actinomycetota bacterium]
MAPRTVRRHDVIVRIAAAIMLALVTWVALKAMPFYPVWMEFLLALGVGALGFFSAASASLLFIGVLSIPVMAADLVTGVAFLVIGLVATQYLSAGRAGGFVLAAIGVAAIPLHAEWAIVAVAGYLLGRGKGALTSVTVCLTAVAAGIALGAPALGSIMTGGNAPGFVSFAAVPDAALEFGWLIPAVKAADPARAFDAITGIQRPVLVGAEAMLWALAGPLSAAFRQSKVKALGLVGPASAVVMLAIGHLAIDLAFGGPVGTTTLLITLAVSLPVALAIAAAATWVFPEVPVIAQPAVEGPRNVDDLLRTIASAEDELAARHNTEAVVMITDMKSFSAMTEEIGSVESAKIVQRHRDLLLPIIRANRGKGAPTGGDGIVAAFKSSADAANAAIAMQSALEGYTGSDRSPHELSVRVGIASGEVVLDNTGSPFLGAALNLAARVMDLADGGRVMTTGQVAGGSGLTPAFIHAHGEFKLKNIAEPVPVVEILWKDGMSPQDIRAT